MNKTILFILSILIISASSCKKKESTPEAPAQTTTGSSPTIVGTAYSGLFSTQLWTSITSAGTYTVGYAQNMVYLSASDFSSFNLPTGTFLSAGAISLNGTTFKNNFNYYTDSTNTPQQDPFVWQASGSTVPAFTFTNTNTYPTFTGHSAWTDTIRKSNSLVLSLSGITNMDEAYIYLASTSSSSPVATGTLLTSTTSFSFSPSTISALSTSTNAIIQIDLYRNNIQTINGKKMNFRSVGTYVKTLPVKN